MSDRDLVLQYDKSIPKDLEARLATFVRSVIQIERPVLTPEDYPTIVRELVKNYTLLSEKPARDLIPRTYVLRVETELWVIVHSHTNMIVSYASCAQKGERAINGILEIIENLFGVVSIRLLDRKYKSLVRDILIKENMILAIAMFGGALSIVLFVNSFIQKLSLELMLGIPIAASLILTLLLSKRRREVAASRI